jgi:hypothetical protein
MAAVPPLFRHRASPVSFKYGTTSSVAILKYQLVLFGASSSVVTGTTAADTELAIGIANEAVSSAEAGATKKVEVLLLAAGDIYPMLAGGTVTAGKRVACEGTDGKIVDVGATPASGSVIGIALASTSTEDDLIPVLIAPA